MIKPLAPIFTAHLFEELEHALFDLLRSLSPDDWERPTVVPQWKVKDVAAHLLDTQLRKLSLVRDGYVAERPTITSNADLVAFINRLNQEGAALYRRLSPAVLMALMEVASRQSWQFHQALDPFGPAVFAVSWAGENQSANWFDTAREFTERWHHQQQIRLAAHKPGIMTRAFYYPVLDTFMRALPFHYRNVESDPGALVQVDVLGDCGGSWHLYRSGAQWELSAFSVGDKLAEVRIPQEIAWRIFTKGIDRQTASAQIACDGNAETGLHLLSMLSIIG